MSNHEQTNHEVSPTGDGAPTVEPPRLELLPYALAEQAKRANFSKVVAWCSALTAALALAAGVAAFGLYDHARQANLITAKSEETAGLNQTIKALEKRIGAVEAARTHDESANMRKVAVEMKSQGATGRELTAGLAQANARLDKLTDRLDHETAGKLAELTARLDKQEKHPVLAAATPAKPAVPLAQSVSNETTGAIERPRLRGYWLVEAQEGLAVIDGRDGPQQVTPGDVLPGLGRVQRIERRGRSWVVVTSAGLIAGGQPPY